MKHPITEFTNRLARHHDELKWLYCELYHDEEAFAYFVQMLKRSWDQRKTALRNQDVKRERVARITAESAGGDGTVKKQPVKKAAKIGRNEPCPCGSGLKWKKCTCPEYHPDLQGPAKG